MTFISFTLKEYHGTNTSPTFINVIFSTLTLALLYPIFTTDNAAQSNEKIEAETSATKMVYRPRTNNYLRTCNFLFISLIISIAVAFGDDDVVTYAIGFLVILLFLAIASVWNLRK